MTKVGLLSDTHGFLDPRLEEHFKNCDEIWHAGDFGNISISQQLSALKPLRGVYGNIDGQDIRKIHPLHLRFNCEELQVWITHIGGFPGKYHPSVRRELQNNPPGLFICGHSHILKIIHDKQFNLIHINPGAAGKEGFHQVRTAVRFAVEKTKIRDLEIIELGTR